jgi:hypothetical protein
MTGVSHFLASSRIGKSLSYSEMNRSICCLLRHFLIRQNVTVPFRDRAARFWWQLRDLKIYEFRLTPGCEEDGRESLRQYREIEGYWPTDIPN